MVACFPLRQCVTKLQKSVLSDVPKMKTNDRKEPSSDRDSVSFTIAGLPEQVPALFSAHLRAWVKDVVV